MMPDILAEWMRRRGHKVIRSASSYWVDAGPHVYQAFPYHWVISPDKEEIAQIFLDHHAVSVRYSTPLNAKTGCLSYHVVYQESAYGYDRLSKKARHDVQKGLSISTIEPISFQRLATEGWKLRQETLIRQGRQHAESERWWTKLCLSAEGLNGFEAWGAIVNKKLAAALLAFFCDDHFSIFYHQSLTEYLPFGINNSLAYAVTVEVLKRTGPPKLFYGLHSLDAPPSVDEFKFRMGYEAKPVRQKIEFHPLFKPFVNQASQAILLGAQKLFPASSTLTKIDGMFRFYLQGKLPLTQQTPPNPLRGYPSYIY